MILITELEYTEFFNNHQAKCMSAIYSQEVNKNLYSV